MVCQSLQGVSSYHAISPGYTPLAELPVPRSQLRCLVVVEPLDASDNIGRAVNKVAVKALVQAAAQVPGNVFASLAFAFAHDAACVWCVNAWVWYSCQAYEDVVMHDRLWCDLLQRCRAHM